MIFDLGAILFLYFKHYAHLISFTYWPDQDLQYNIEYKCWEGT